VELLSATSVKNGDKLAIDALVFSLIEKNINMVKEAFKTFGIIDWIITNEIALERVSLRDLYELLKAAVEGVSEYIPYGENRILVNEFNEIHSGLHVNLNREYFYKALYEVLVNALKFSRPKSVIVSLMSVSDKNVNISIINDPEKSEGTVGIPAELEKVVFEPFFRLSKNVFEKYNTLDFGLGLTLIEKIMKKHNGEVIAHNIIDHSETQRDPQIKVNVAMTLPLEK
jgi:signal transduction histidine kinase